MLLNIFSKTNKYYYRTIILTLFVLIGFIISIISIFANGYYQLNSIHNEFDSSSKSTLLYKKDFLYIQTKNFKNYLSAVDGSEEFKEFIQSNPKEDTNYKIHITDIMMAISKADPNIMQFRFLGRNGCEAIRIDRDSIGALPYKIKKERLQSKGERYYFKETKDVGKDNLWFSKIDLNMERGEIVKPIVPTLRIAKPYFYKDEFKGILIINVFMKNILVEIMESQLFNVAIIDKDSHILVTNFKGYKEDAIEWTRYLNDSNNIRYETDKYKNDSIFDKLIERKRSSIELSNVLINGEGLKLIVEQKPEYILKSTKDLKNYMLVMILLVFTISFPLAIFLSRYPLKIHEDLNKQLEIVDKYVYLTRTDLKGNITDVSEAYSRLSGYSKDELIGKNHRVLKHPSIHKSVYKAMWESILNGQSWSGELKNITKDGKVFSIIAHIAPVIENGVTTGFTSIRENITDQKLIEEISTKDELTQAYNRRFFKQIFSRELKRAKRKGDMFSIAMFDIDYFKKYNDTNGHIKGDDALIAVVEGISTKMQRAGDYIFRVGGEEFIVIYSEMKNFEEAEKFSSELVKAVENLKIEHKSSEVSAVLTISLGLLNVTPACEMDEEAILKRIDELLYNAKKAGRNQLKSIEC